jgi:photosystem II stability/assembly factor-like uncharacterized protein
MRKFLKQVQYKLRKANYLSWFTFLAIFLFTETLFSQNEWTWQSPYPQINDLLDVQMVNENIYYAVGYKGTFIKTTDGGENWQVSFQLFDIEQDFIKVQFTDDEVGWILADENIFLKTTDSGNNWVKTVFTDSSLITSFYFIDNSTGFLVGENGLMKKSIDGGLIWSDWNSTVEDDLKDVFFLNNNKGWAVGENNTIIKSTDGGLNWIHQNGAGSGKSVQFIDSDYGWIGINNTFLKTTNGGTSWRKITIDQYFLAHSIYFTDRNNGWAVGTRHEIYTTTDGGNNWIENSVDLKYWTDLYAVNFIDPLNGIAVGERGYILETTNGGKDWSYPPSHYFSTIFDIQFLNDNVGWVVSTNDYPYSSDIKRTTDGGRTWEIKKSNVYGEFKSLDFLNVNLGWIVGRYIFKAVDDSIGIPQYTDSTLWLYSVDFIDSLSGWTAGFDGRILKTTDSGENWFDLNSGTKNTLTGIQFLNKNIGWVVGELGTIRETTDGGETWNSIFNPDSTNFTDLAFVNENEGWVSGIGIKHTSDGGVTWEQQYNELSSFHSITFIDENIGYAAGDGGLIIKTTNGGKDWIDQKRMIDGRLWSINFLDANTGWVAGQQGTVLKTSDGGGSFVIENQQIKPIPNGYSISQNYPNPFNPTTVINYQIPQQGFVTLKIFDVLGREVVTLVNEKKPAGGYKVSFNAVDLASGVYIYRMKVNDFIESKKMILLR